MPPFTLTDTKNLACHGTSFGSVAAARNYAAGLQRVGLCETYSVGEYRDGKFVKVYDSVERSECQRNDQ